MARSATLRLWAPPALLAALTIGLGFNAGGFFAKALGVAVVVLALAMVLRVALAHKPLEGMDRPLAIAIAAMALLVVWTFASSSWSGAGFRSLAQADRVLLYALALVFFGSWARSDERVSAMLKAMLLACVVLCGAGLISRLLPDVWALGVDQRRNRLQYPVTYANTMGLLAALGLLFSFALSASARESRIMRVAAAAAVPITAATLVLTYSRGAIGAVAVGFVALLALGRTRAMLSAFLAVVGPAAVTGYAAYRADLLATADFTSAATLAQGHRVALVVVIAAAAAAVLRAALLAQDDRPIAVRIPVRRRRALIAALSSASVVAIVALAVAVDLPHELSEQRDRLRQPESAATTETSDVRDRLTDTGSSQRLDAWRIALQDFRAAPVLGRGAGTFVLSWNERRTQHLPFNQTHSVYLQMLGELGIVGLALIVIALLTILVVCAWRARGPARPLYAAVFAGALTWTLSAAVDWQWQMPVATLWLFALGATALASASDRASSSRPVRWPVRVALALGLLAVTVMPARVALSERSLSRAVAAFQREDCGRAAPAAREARTLVGVRPEPHELLAYCAVRQGDARRGVREARRAVELDPDNWRTHYALGLVLAASGLDPRPSVEEALRLNQREPLVYKARARFVGSDPAGWRRQAAASPIQLEQGPS